MYYVISSDIYICITLYCQSVCIQLVKYNKQAPCACCLCPHDEHRSWILSYACCLYRFHRCLWNTVTTRWICRQLLKILMHFFNILRDKVVHPHVCCVFIHHFIREFLQIDEKETKRNTGIRIRINMKLIVSLPRTMFNYLTEPSTHEKHTTLAYEYI